MNQPRRHSPPISPLDGDTPPDAWEETLGRAIDAGQLDAVQSADPKLAGVFAAHQKLESLFALLRGESEEAEPDPAQLGRYQIQSTLGTGAFGTVYLAHDPELNRAVAVKVSRSGTFASAGALDKFRTEARHAASLDHPSIVTIHDVGREANRLYIVMQYVRGRTLADAIADGPLAPEHVAELSAEVAGALHHAHKLSFVHRDLKPANILLDEHGRPHVADFGLAVSDKTQRSLAGQVAGTPAYMSPEQVRGESHRLDGRTDVWALGVVLYESIAARRPFDGQSDRELFDEIEHRDPKPPRQLNDAIPPELERICLKCLAKRMTDRYSTAADLAADLREFLSRPKQAPRAPGAIGTPAEQPARESDLPKVAPKGLRSFDAHDADFFLQLLPGPTDRDGLPESLRFWKTRIEQTDADQTFSVGLLYGPSGCGKSSLMKAGLLPRLASHVLPVYLEATADDTEARLHKGLRKRMPDLAVGDLTAAIVELRGGAGLAKGTKLLIVLDQFEQWLHARGNFQATELVRALRQCDGEHVQCVVMVRDDFWLAASQFMRELEIPLEGENSGAVYLFDARHSRRVLTLFGRAYGCLPPANDPSAAQSQFIEQAVAELADDGNVIPVRLALFAEMVKGKPWTPATLKEIGGIAGVGVTFLEETFSATTAPPQHRLHQKAAQAVLKALLPPAGADIRGHKRSQGELLDASGYASQPQDFGQLMRILDAELRLITPTDPDATDPDRPEPRGAAAEKYYQLTHDYLVPSLRDWLTGKQRETRRGRAELRLAERAAAYNAKRDARNLPGWWEWPNILLFTRRRNWIAAERRMMRAAGRRRGLQAMLVVALAMAGTLAGREARRRVNEDRDRVLADGIVQRLLEAPLATVPADADELEPYRQWTDAKLRRVLADDSNSNADRRLRASIGLLPVDAAQAGPIYEAMLNSTPEGARVLVGILKPHGAELVERLWQLVANHEASPSSRLRGAMALADFTPAGADRDRWLPVAPFVVDQMLAEARRDPSQYEPLVASLAPAAKFLLPALGVAFRDARRNASERDLATRIVARYAASDPATLVDLICDAEPEQFLTLFPTLEKQPGPAIALLPAELDKEATFDWRQANAAVALVRLGQHDQFWPRLTHGPDPRLRSWLIHRFGPLGVEPHLLVKRLLASAALPPSAATPVKGARSRPIKEVLFDPETSIRRAIILALGEFDKGRLAPTEHEPLIERLTEIYRRDPDAGVHSAAAWLARRWGSGSRIEELDAAQRGEKPPPDGRRWYVNSEGQTMVVISGPVEFLMGSPADEPGREIFELLHESHIARSFAIGAHEVTVDQAKRWRPAFNYGIQSAPSGDCPVNGVSWYDAAEYCNWLSEQERLTPCYEPNAEGRYAEGMRPAADHLSRDGYRLPTEDEWEFACRAGAATSRYFGASEALLGQYACYAANSQQHTFEVGSLKPNDLGLFDALGNVWEWCDGFYYAEVHSYPRLDRTVRDPVTTSRRGNMNSGVLRGGGHVSCLSDIRSAARYESSPMYRSFELGFRVARTLPAASLSP